MTIPSALISRVTLVRVERGQSNSSSTFRTKSSKCLNEVLRLIARRFDGIEVHGHCDEAGHMRP